MGTVLEREPWIRQHGESRQAFAAFAAYRDLGPARSLAKVGRQLGKSTALLERWSARDGWVERAAAWDGELDRCKREKQLAAIEEMAERHAAVACLFQHKVIETLNGMTAEQVAALTPSELIAWLTQAARLERLSRGEPEDIARLNHAGAEGTEPLLVPPVQQTVVVETVVRNKAELRAALHQAALAGIETVTGSGSGPVDF
jgi:hypothetical protein